MAWISDDAWRTCGDLLATLRDALPDIGWERADAEADDGLIYFINRYGDAVDVIIVREALQNYVDADEQD